MSFSNWLHNIAIGVIAAILCGMPLQSGCAQPVDNDARTQPSPTQAQDQPKSDDSILILESIKREIERVARAIEAQKDDPDAKKKEERENSDLKAQWEMARWAEKAAYIALGAFIVTIIGVLLIWRTLVHTRRAAEAAADMVEESKKATNAANRAVEGAADTAKRQLRAYVNVKSAKAEFFPDRKEMRFMVIIENKGQTPARKVSEWATCHVAPRFNQSVSVKDRSGGSVNPIGPGGKLKIEFGTLGRRVPIEAVIAARTGQTNLWVHGLVEYVDIFDKPQFLTFRFHIETGEIDKPDMEICPEGNDDST